MNRDHRARRHQRQPSTRGPSPRTLAVLVACAIIWIGGRAEAAEVSRTPRSGGAARTRVERPAIAADASPRNEASSALASETAAALLPLQRETDFGAPSGWALLRGTLLIAGVLAVGGAVLLRNRLRGSPSRFAPVRPGWRRWLAPIGSHSLQVVQSTRLTARASVHVVRWAGKDWLVGCTEHGMTVLGRRPPPADASPDAAGADSQGGSPPSRPDRDRDGE